MSAVWMRAISELRTRLRATISLILLVGLGAGVVISAAAGARRTQTAYPRFLETSHAADALISVLQTGIPSFYPAVARLPEVERAGIAAGVNVFYIRPSGAVDARTTALASVDGRFGNTIERPKLLAGRLYRSDRPFEAMVNRFLADQLDLSVGDTLTMRTFPSGVPEGDPEHVPPSLGLRQTFTVVGIAVVPEDVIPLAELDSAPTLLLTPAYFRQYTEPGTLQFDGLAVRLKPGADMGRFRAKVDRLAAAHREEVGDEIFVGDLRDHAARVERAIAPQWLALALFALLAGLAALFGIGQIVSRQVFLDSSEYPILRGLGMTKGQLIGAASVRVLIVAVGGGLLAVTVAVLSSSLFPIGPARLAEPNPGLSVNLAILGVGFLATVVLLLAVAAIPALRAASAPAGVGGMAEVAGSERPSRLASAASRMLTPVAASGFRMALEPGHGRTAVPVRSAIVGLVGAIAAVTAAFTFGANLNRLVDTPRLYGWNWSVAPDAAFGSLSKEATLNILQSNRSVRAVAGGNYGTVTINGVLIPAVGLDQLEGTVFPTLIEGRPPSNPREIVLGTSTLRSIDAAVGDQVKVESQGRTTAMSIVGRAVFPSFGRGSFTPTGLGEGAATTAAMFPPFEFPGAPPGPSYNFYLVRFAAQADVDTVAAQLRNQLRAVCPPVECGLRTAQPPYDITNFARIRATPLLLAGLLAVLGVAMIAHALATSVRRRRHDLAILKTLGFVRRQISATVAWQATTFAAVGLVIGIPLGVGAGRWVWTLFAEQLGVPPEPTVSLPAILLAIPITVLVANLVAALPGRIASRMQPAQVLRTE
ncbi:MAG: FtsX-like permease family protein [Actinomycetota bacterium]